MWVYQALLQCVCVFSFNSHSKSVCEGVRDWSQGGLAINMCVHACVCVCVCVCACVCVRARGT